MKNKYFIIKGKFLLERKEKIFLFGEIENEINLEGKKVKINDKNIKIDTVEFVKIKNKEFLALGFNYKNRNTLMLDLESIKDNSKVEILE